MTPEQAGIVRSSFVKVLAIKDIAGQLFYRRLFEIAPELRPLFKVDIDIQARKLMETLAVAIGSMRNSTALTAMLEQLALRHVEYGVKIEHYASVGDALLWTLEKGLGSDFTPQMRGAWEALYHDIAQTMIASVSLDTKINRPKTPH